ncbi:unnamed protein product [Linum tenue]|uniref:B-like cyclin n=1 Tax=Linum tenue TaxID=586396 RepID=A0AAV0MEW1_9ROSI|nr:unnamed protein product [Linum tenue]
MNKENRNDAKVEEPAVRITRARARASGASAGVLPASKPSFKHEQKRVTKVSSKRPASEENKMGGGVQCKKRTVLQEVTNILTEHSDANSTNATRAQYEEILAPQVEEFCFITDNTYKREEVLKMERQVVDMMHFNLSVPTTKTFLRRFIQAAQTSYKDPCLELEYLANYLAELTLVEYDFIKFLPSLIAASAVFLARWTLNQSVHPWNPTLEHYTNYRAPELRSTVLALEDLQLNISRCPLNAIREKYRLQKVNYMLENSSCRQTPYTS